jgi:hypothetical protein
MKLTKVLVVLVSTAVALAGCYWTPAETQSGGISLSVGLARGVVAPGEYTYAFRVTLYESGDVEALYGSPPSSPTPYDLLDWIGVTVSGSPIPMDGHSYYDAFLGDLFDPYNPASGLLTIADILPGKKYRIHVQLGQYDPAPDFYLVLEGVSGEFEVIPGSVVDVAVDLYLQYAS